MDQKVTKDDLFSLLARASTISKPDEFQQRHNDLTRAIAAYLLADFLETQEGIEDP